MLRAILLRDETLLIAAACPAVFINFGHGQNGFLTAALLATPYVLDYDLVVLAVAIAFFARHGLQHSFRNYEISLLAAAWVALRCGRAGSPARPASRSG
jgi:hypothetical protein